MSDNSTIHLIGNAHLDPIWLWRWQEGCGEVLQTFRSALDRLNEYPDFIFTCSSAAYYSWVEEIDPDMFQEIKERVQQGRIVPVNGWWVQTDCNIPSGESFARQALYGQLYYYEKFGITCKTGYNVDSFGHNGMMPQLLLQGGMKAYVMMRPHPNENPDIPQNVFWWDSADGSRVIVYRIPLGYGEHGKEVIDRAIEDLENRIKDTKHSMMLFYGIGNHGGGPTKGDIDYLKSISKRKGFHELEFSNPDDFFNDILLNTDKLPIWNDDMQHHASGCYSATSLVKQLNRKAENHLATSEKWSTIASLSKRLPNATKDFEKAWKEVCFNQFHDILCGCSIMEAYEDVKESMGYAMKLASDNYNNALLRIARSIDTWIEGVSEPQTTEVRNLGASKKFPRPIVVFNNLSWDVNVPVRTYHPSKSVTDSNGEAVAFQNVRSSRSNDTHLDTLFIASIPAMGYATYWLWHIESEEAFKEFPKTSIKTGKEPLCMENEYVKVEFCKKTGGIKVLINKEDGVNYAADNTLAVPTVIDDHISDTWAHNIFKFHDIKGTMSLKSIEIVEDGPARAVVRTTHKFNESELVQDFSLSEGQKTLRVKCKAIWSEKFTMLKIPFNIGGSKEISTYEIPAGYIKRPCNGEEEPALQWADLTVTGNDGNRRGISIMSDSKYSYDCPGTELRLTCLRNVIFADHYSHRPKAAFNFTDEGLQRFEYGIYLHAGEVEETSVVREAALFNNRPFAVPESYHKGTEPQVKSFFTVDAKNVIVTAIKFCEDNSGDVILRLYETAGKESRAMVVCELLDAAFWFDICKHEIKTFRIKQDGSVTEVDFLEGIPE